MLERGKRRRTRHLDVFLAASPVSHSRFGLIVPKHGRRIVERNLLKRRLREIGRRAVLPALRDGSVEPLDLLVRTKPSAYGLDYAMLERELLTVVEKACSENS